MPRLYLANEMRQYLLDEGIARGPEEVELSPLPPCFVEAQEGCPDPADIEEQTGEPCPAAIHLLYQGGEPTEFLFGVKEVRVIGVEVRAQDNRTALDLCQDIAEALDDKVHAYLGALLVSNCRMIEQPTRVPWRYPNVSSTYAMSFRVGLRRSDYEISSS